MRALGRCSSLVIAALVLVACEDGGDKNGDPTGGCGVDPGIPTGEWVERTVNAGGTNRVYFVWLPDGYDPDRAYPVVYQFHGCSDNRETNNVPVQNESGGEAIHVRGRAIDNCWDDAPDGAGVALFDAMVPAVEGELCADATRRFATGYSSGSFMTHRLACLRAHMLRGVATIAGGHGGSDCTGSVAALLIHDEDDTTVSISASEGARDSHLERNGCDTSATPTPTDHPPCEQYTGCDAGYPVVWCQTTGQGHSRQDSLAAPAFWDFLAAL